MEHIGTTAEKLIKQWQNKQCTGKEDAIQNVLKTFFTRQEQRHIKTCSLENQRIILGIDSCAWLYMINFKKERLLKRLNQVFKPEDINEIFLRLDTQRKKPINIWAKKRR